MVALSGEAACAGRARSACACPASRRQRQRDRIRTCGGMQRSGHIACSTQDRFGHVIRMGITYGWNAHARRRWAKDPLNLPGRRATLRWQVARPRPAVPFHVLQRSGAGRIRS
ncbi:hypothetical protein GCM10027400_23620 [Pseudoxanthomonas daejeonensis]